MIGPSDGWCESILNKMLNMVNMANINLQLQHPSLDDHQTPFYSTLNGDTWPTISEKC